MKIQPSKTGFMLLADDGTPIGTFPDRESAERQKLLLEYQAESKKPAEQQKLTPQMVQLKKDRDNAANVYSMAQAAYDKGDYANAAALFQTANNIIPHKAASDAAFRAAQMDEQK